MQDRDCDNIKGIIIFGNKINSMNSLFSKYIRYVSKLSVYNQY